MSCANSSTHFIKATLEEASRFAGGNPGSPELERRSLLAADAGFEAGPVCLGSQTPVSAPEGRPAGGHSPGAPKRGLGLFHSLTDLQSSAWHTASWSLSLGMLRAWWLAAAHLGPATVLAILNKGTEDASRHLHGHHRVLSTVDAHSADEDTEAPRAAGAKKSPKALGKPPRAGRQAGLCGVHGLPREEGPWGQKRGRQTARPTGRAVGRGPGKRCGRRDGGASPRTCARRQVGAA
nr:uncharacterized protein LOC105882315 isoform X2 [Microcebus murinus]